MEPIPITDFFNLIMGQIPYITFAILGGLVGLFVNGNDGNLHRNILERLTMATFIAIITINIAIEMKLSNNITIVAVGLAGFISTDVLPILKTSLSAKLIQELKNRKNL
jgi:hypothetical protein